jgi:hypothetical protein
MESNESTKNKKPDPKILAISAQPLSEDNFSPEQVVA